MKKLLNIILVLFLLASANAQSPLRINKFLVDSFRASTGFWAIYHDSTHTGQWGLVAGGGGAGGGVTSVGQSFTGGLISVSGSPITTSGTLALTVAGTSGGIPYFSSASTWASSGLLAANALMIGGGAGAAPSTTTTGTGVLTALGINIGSTGAFLTKGNATYVVAASNSPAVLKARADYVCDGTADESEINTALALGNVTLVEGTYNIAATIPMPDNRWLKGSGDGTILVVATGISVITDNGTTGIMVSDLKITGNGTASQRGIYMTSVGSGTGTTAVTGCVIENVYITGTDIAGIELELCANSIINNIRTTDIDFDGIVIDRGSRVTVSNTVHNGNNAGIFVTGATSTHLTIINNIIEGSVDIGIQIENATDCNISNNIVRSSESFCLDIQNSERMLVDGNTLDASAVQVVFNTSSVPNSVFSNNLIMNGQVEGFIISSCENSTVTGNTIYNNSLLTNNTYDAVSIFSDDVTFVGNTVKRGTGNQHRYGLRITLGSDRNLIADNKFYQAGATGDISDASTLTRKRSNQANDGTWLDLLYTDIQLEMNTSRLLGRSTAAQGKAEEITVGTGVFTALGVNTGSSGAFVVNGGALGTPSSGTLTNATGLPPTTGIVGWPANSAGALTNDGAGNLTWSAAGGATTWNGITNPTGDQALTFDAGESSTWTDANTTEDLFTVNSSTGTTNSMFSYNRTGTALAAGNNIMELVSSGANGTGGITATGALISVTNTGATSTNNALTLTASGATTNNAINVTAGRTLLPAGTSAASSQSLYLGSTGLFDVSGVGVGFYYGAGSGYQVFLGQSGLLLGQNTAVIDFGQQGTFSTVNRIRMSATAEGTVKFHSLGLTAATIIKGTGGEGTASSLYLEADEADDAADTWQLNSTTANLLTFVNGSTQTLSLSTNGSLWSVRNSQNQGADVASVAGAIALGTDGNAFEITGTNAITLISNVNWQNGAVVTLAFTSTATLTDGTANSGTDIGMELAGNANFTASAGATLTLRLIEIGGTQRWREVSRSVQ